MMASLPTLAVVVLAAGPMNDIGISANSERSIARAEMDFDARRAELGLVGSAPMIGLERIESLTSEDFDARRAELGLIGSAPMVGLEPSSHEAAIERASSSSALAEPPAKTSSARRRTR